ncbi:cytochrome c551, partial [Bacillus sp. B-TM1]
YAKDLSGATGPDLRKVGQKYDAADIEKIIEKGRGSMSPGIIQGEDAKKVAEWLAEHK